MGADKKTKWEKPFCRANGIENANSKEKGWENYSI
jgi:hypothetical protein